MLCYPGILNVAQGERFELSLPVRTNGFPVRRCSQAEPSLHLGITIPLPPRDIWQGIGDAIPFSAEGVIRTLVAREDKGDSSPSQYQAVPPRHDVEVPAGFEPTPPGIPLLCDTFFLRKWVRAWRTANYSTGP